MEAVYAEKVYHKEIGKQFLEDLTDNIKSKTSSPASKYFSLEVKFFINLDSSSTHHSFIS